MQLSDLNPLSHFAELDLLPRTLFALGAVLLGVSVYLKTVPLGLCGVGLIFSGVALTLFFLILYKDQDEKPKWHVSWQVLLQFLLATALAFCLFRVSLHVQRHSELPSFLKPEHNLIQPSAPRLP